MPPEPFAKIVAGLDAPMVIVTAADATRRDGCLVGFHTQCSMKPRRWLVCLSKLNETTQIALVATHLVVHFLRRGQHALAEHFGGQTAFRADKLRDVAWEPGPGGAPVLPDCDYVAGPILERFDVGDHVAHIIAVEHIVPGHPATKVELGFQSARDIAPGNPP